MEEGAVVHPRQIKALPIVAFAVWYLISWVLVFLPPAMVDLYLCVNNSNLLRLRRFIAEHQEDLKKKSIHIYMCICI